jgi:hypothetical protein
MNAVFAIIGLYALATFILVFVYEKPKKNRKKITGRGGDFES